MMLIEPETLLATLAVGVVALLVVGLARAARRAGRTRPWRAAAGVGIGLVLWLALTAGLAAGGVLADWDARPPRVPLLPLTALTAFVLISRTAAFRRLLAAVPAWQPIALQTFRVGVEVVFWQFYQRGVVPVQMTIEGRNIDGLVGLTAPLLAAGIAAGLVGPRLTVAWNLIGLALLANAIGTTATSVPGPLYLGWPGAPFTAIATWPAVWVPALLAPTGVFLHVVSIRLAVAAGRSRQQPLVSTHQNGVVL